MGPTDAPLESTATRLLSSVDADADDDGDNNDDVPVVETHTADAACLVHVL